MKRTNISKQAKKISAQNYINNKTHSQFNNPRLSTKGSVYMTK